MAAPTRVTGGNVSLSTIANTKTTASFNVTAGDLLVVMAGSDGPGNGFGTPSASGGSVTWTLRQSHNNVAGFADCFVWTGAVGATATGITLSITTSGGQRWGFAYTLWRDHGGVGVSGKDAMDWDGAPRLTLSLSENSAVQSASMDYAAQTGTITWRTVNGSAMTSQVTIQHAAYSAYYGYKLDCGAAGNETVGTSTPDPQTWTIVAVEILAGVSNITATPTAIASDESFGSPTMTGNITLSPTGIASAEAMGIPTETGNINLSPSGIATVEAFGNPSISTALTVSPTGISSAETFGNPNRTGNVTLVASGIGTQEAFGSPTADVQAAEIVTAQGIPSAEAFGSPTMTGSTILIAVGIGTQEGVGTPTHRGSIVMVAQSINSAEVFGVPFIMSDELYGPSGIGSTEAFGIPFANSGSLWALPRDPMDYSVADLEYEYYSRLSGLPLYHTINDHKYYFYKAYLGGMEGELDDLEYEYWKSKSGLVGNYSLADYKISVFETATGGVYRNDDGKTYYAQYFQQGT